MKVKRIIRGNYALMKVCLLCATSTSLSAQTILESYTQAKEHSPGYRGQVYASESVRAAATQSRSGYLPQVNFSYSRSKNWQDVIDAKHTIFPVEETDYSSGNVSLTLTQTIYNGNQLAELRRSESEVKRSDYELMASEEALILDVTTAYFGVLSAHDNLKYTTAQQKVVNSEARLMERKFQKGNANRVELQEVLARRAEVSAGAAEAEQIRIEAEQAMMEMTGQLPQNLQSVRKDLNTNAFELGDIKQWLKKAESTNAALQAKQAQWQSAKESVSGKQAGHYPTVDFSYTYTRDDSGGSLYGGGNEIDTKVAKLTLNVPIYAGGGTEAGLKQARAQANSAEQELIQVKRQLTRTVHSAWHGIKSSQSRIAAMEESVAAYEVALKAKRSGHKSGLFSVIDVLDAERNYYKALQDAARSRYDYIINILRLKQAAGELDETSLKLVQGWMQG